MAKHATTQGTVMLQAEDVHVVVRGEVDDKQRQHARERIAHAARHVRDPILFARVTLTAAPEPPRGRPVMVRALLDVSGQTVQAATSAATMHEGLDHLHDRLRDQFAHLASRRQARRRRAERDAELHNAFTLV